MPRGLPPRQLLPPLHRGNMSADFQRWMGELVAWQMGQNAAIQNAAAAAGYGLDPAKIGLTPFPGTAQPVTINTVIAPPAPAAIPAALPVPTPTPAALPTPTPAPTASSAPGWLLPILAAAGIALGGGALGVSSGVIPTKSASVQPAAIAAPAAPVAPAAPAAQVIPVAPANPGTVTWVSSDGGKTWKEVLPTTQ